MEKHKIPNTIGKYINQSMSYNSYETFFSRIQKLLGHAKYIETQACVNNQSRTDD